MSVLEFTSEQVSQQAQGNLNAFILGTNAYLKGQDQTSQEWVMFLGKRFAPLWEEVKGQGARAAMEATVLNFVSAGGTVQAFEGDEIRAEAIIGDWPAAELLGLLGLTLEDVDPFYEIFTPVAAYLNLRFAWHREGNQVTFTYTG